MVAWEVVHLLLKVEVFSDGSWGFLAFTATAVAAWGFS